MEKEKQLSFHPRKDCPEMNRKANLIVEAAAQVYSVDPALLMSYSREKDDVNARHVAMYLCHARLDLSYKEIAASFHRSDFASVMVTCQKVDQQRKTDPYYFLKADEVEFILNGICNI